MKIFIGAIIGFIVIALLFVIIHSVNHPCIKSHQQIVHHSGYTTWESHRIFNHYTNVPVYHSAYNNVETICDQYK